MILFPFFFLFLNLLSQCQSLNFGFKTKQGDRIVIGEFNNNPSSVQIRRVLCELNSLRESFHSTLKSPRLSISFKRIIKHVHNYVDNAEKGFYEIEIYRLIGHLRANLAGSHYLATYGIIFENPSIIISRHGCFEIPAEILLTDAISIDLRKEFAEQDFEMGSANVDHYNSIKENAITSINGCSIL